MKKLLFILLILLVSKVNAQEKGWKMAVLSDVHIMAPELLKSDGAAFHDYIVHDRKMLVDGPKLLDYAIQDILHEHPKVVIITGDLTKDGEKVSHLYLANQLLRPLLNAGIAVYVVPGNHDVNNPHAAYFDGDSLTRTQSVSPQEFAEIYKDYGYGKAIARDPHSLSYVVQLNDSTRLMGLDACRYEENDFDKNICVTDGCFKPETLAFIQQQVADAKKAGCHILTMMHHGVVEHWKWQNKVMNEYLVDDWEKIAKSFAKMNLNIVFTGHFHAQDIVRFDVGKHFVYDIETGSTLSYPMPYRLIDFKGKEMVIQSKKIQAISGYKSFDELEQKAKQYAISSITTYIEELFPPRIPQSVGHACGEILSEAYLAHLEGDEQMPADYIPRLKKVCKLLRPYSWKYAFALNKLGHYLYHDVNTPDNNVTIHTQFAY